MKRIAFLMIALFMIGGVVMAQGQRGEHKKMTPAERAEKMTERMVKEYSLNDAQSKAARISNRPILLYLSSLY